jgi:hypothetical protein
MTDQEFEEFRSTRREAGKDIDPANAEVEWIYAQTMDPYGVDPELPVECQQVGREHFARSPGSDIWVWFGDLPPATRDTLWELQGRGRDAEALRHLLHGNVGIGQECFGVRKVFR